MPVRLLLARFGMACCPHHIGSAWVGYLGLWRGRGCQMPTPGPLLAPVAFAQKRRVEYVANAAV